MDLFAFDEADRRRSFAPLAERMRPQTLNDFLGQPQLLGEDSILRRAIEQDQLHSMIFYGPPGCGKTTLAQLIATQSKAQFLRLNAVEAAVKDVRDIMERAKDERALYAKRTILFLDEVHRFNTARQDVLLPAVEQGDLILIGATTENPFHHINGALLSRCTLYEFQRLTSEQVQQAIAQALVDRERGLGDLPLDFAEDALHYLADSANGDVRRALNALEAAVLCSSPTPSGRYQLTKTTLAEALRQPLPRADRTTQYDVLSAFHKTVRASNREAVLWFLYGVERLGMDPLVFARRLVVACSEDIGLADPQAMVQATTAYVAYERIGWPEAKYNLVQAIQYAVEAPKSRFVADELAQTMQKITDQAEFVVPRNLRNY